MDDIAPIKTDWRRGLPVRMFALTVGIILFVELLIYVPSAASFRVNWLTERAQAARIATLALRAAPTQMVSDDLAADLLSNAEVLGVAEIGHGTDEERMLPARAALRGPVHEVDLTSYRPFMNILELVDVFVAPPDRILLVRAKGTMDGTTLEVLVPEAPLRSALYGFSQRILALSLLISATAGLLVFLALYYTVVRPVQRLTGAVVAFRNDPGGFKRRLAPNARRDEIGLAQNALADMEQAVSDSFRQRERLAQLGEAIAKISHDLRNSLAVAQLTSETLAQSEDPRVQRAAPRLERVLERAISLATSTLEYGRSEPPKAATEQVELRAAADYAAEEGLAGHQQVIWRNDIPHDAVGQADAENLHRALVNLIRNAAQAMAEHGGRAEIHVTLAAPSEIEVCDTGPGLPDSAKRNLFKPFAGSSKRDGSGLGLAIARELCRAMGAELQLKRTGPEGTAFEIKLRG